MKNVLTQLLTINRFFFYTLLLLFSATINASDLTADDFPRLGVPEYPGLCAYRGHIGKYRCMKVKAKKHKLYSCKGKNLHYSKVKGNKACYSCPKGYSRTSPTRKMNHRKACTKRQSGKNAYKRAKKVANLVKSCPSGQFKYKGRCSSCPSKTKRMHVAGLDKGYCKVQKRYRCNTGLVLHKSAPKTGWDKAGNLLVPKYKKYCGIPFSLKQYGKDILDTDANKDALEALKTLGKALSKKDRTTKKKVARYKKAIKEGRLQDSFTILQSFAEYQQLVDVLTSTDASASAVGNAAQQFTITSGFVVDGSVVFGYNYEWGTAIDLADGKIKKYKAHGLSKGVSFGGAGGITLGLWKGAFRSGASQGYVGGFDVGPIGHGVGVWSDYYTPKRPGGSNQPHFVGFTYNGGVGLGVEVGEYNEVYTKITREVNM